MPAPLKAFAAIVCLSALACAQGRFELLGTYSGAGGYQDAYVGPGPTAGSERYYVSYIYLNNTFHIVAIDPANGEFKVFKSPTASEWSVKSLVTGADGNIYMGTVPQARFMRLDPRTGEITDLGRPAASETYIWQIARGPDNRIYGCTYPSAKLVRYDPAAGKVEDLGRLDPVEMYGRSVAASADGFVYVGIGYAKSRIAAYEIATGQHRNIMPEQYSVTDAAAVHLGDDGKVYARSGSQHFRLEGWTATPIAASESRPAAPRNRLADGRTIRTVGGKVRLSDGTEFAYGYKGAELPIFRVGLGPDGMLYGSTILPIHFVRMNPGTREMADVGMLGGGEFYSLLRFGNRLLGAAYGGDTPLMSYDPGQGFKPGKESGSNPLLITFEGEDHGWRPMAMIEGPGRKVYIGSVAGYGKLDGPLTVWDPATNKVEQFVVVKNQSVVSLAATKKLVVGGTTVGGGGGSHATEKEAKLFVWDPRAKKVVFETVPVAGAGNITDLIAAPNGRVYGAAGNTLFCFDPKSRKVIHKAELPFRGLQYNSVAVRKDGRIWGLARNGVFTIDPKTHVAELRARSPKPVSAGFAMDGDAIYFCSEWEVYRYRAE